MIPSSLIDLYVTLEVMQSLCSYRCSSQLFISLVTLYNNDKKQEECEKIIPYSLAEDSFLFPVVTFC